MSDNCLAGRVMELVYFLSFLCFKNSHETQPPIIFPPETFNNLRTLDHSDVEENLANYDQQKLKLFSATANTNIYPKKLTFPKNSNFIFFYISSISHLSPLF